MSAREAPGARDPTYLPADIPVPQDNGAPDQDAAEVVTWLRGG